MKMASYPQREKSKMIGIAVVGVVALIIIGFQITSLTEDTVKEKRVSARFTDTSGNFNAVSQIPETEEEPEERSSRRSDDEDDNEPRRTSFAYDFDNFDFSEVDFNAETCRRLVDEIEDAVEDAEDDIDDLEEDLDEIRDEIKELEDELAKETDPDEKDDIEDDIDEEEDDENDKEDEIDDAEDRLDRIEDLEDEIKSRCRSSGG